MAALAGTLLLTVPVMIIGEWVAPAAEPQARAFRFSEQVGQAIIGGPRGMWMRDGTDIVNIGRPLLTADREQQAVEFQRINIYRYDQAVELSSVLRARRAHPMDGGWVLEDVTVSRLGPEGATRERQDRMTWTTQVRPDLLDSAVTRPKLLSLRHLWEYLEYLSENGLDDSVYQAAFWEKILFPFTVFALVLAGMPFVFGQARSQNMGVRLFFGMSIGGLFMIANRALQKFGTVYDLPPLLTMLLPIVVLSVAAILVLRRSV
jgi:lipopolysaccharide export system permease protein